MEVFYLSEYTLSQGILFFFFYCFIGWVWETLFVSVRKSIQQKKILFINRGFLHGPFLPLYGFAVMFVLWLTIPVRNSIWKVYILGMFGITLLELITGVAMEFFMEMKYWDYSDWPFNWRGHICLFSSLFWGVCAVVVVRLIHGPVEGWLLSWKPALTDCLVVCLVVLVGLDFLFSLGEVMDMRKLMKKLSERGELMGKLERRLDAVIAFSPISDPDQSLLQKQYLKARSLIRRNPDMYSRKHRETLHRLKEVIRKHRNK